MISKRLVLMILFALASFSTKAEQDKATYAIVVSKTTLSDNEWSSVVKALVEKHDAEVITYASSIQDSLMRLKEVFPRYTCVVAKHEEATQPFVESVHRMMREFDDDPFTDTIWGILTGFDAAGALEVALHKEPLLIQRVASGTEVELEVCKEGVYYCELNQGHMVQKKKGGEPTVGKAPADTTKALVDSLNEYRPQLFVTSGHATERDWQIGYRYKNGYFRSKGGELFGVDTKGKRFPINSTNPKVYMPIGNCLMGHIDGPDAMALAFMNSAGVYQMLGYTKVTWYGYAGWGCLDYFVEQPGRYTFAEAFHANHHALIHRLEKNFPGMSDVTVDDRGRPSAPLRMSSTAGDRGLVGRDGIGLIFDRDIVAFYGDPAWEARMAEGPLAFGQRLKVEGDRFTFTIQPNLGKDSFLPVNTNGAQRGGRPIVHFLPYRVTEIKVLEGGELNPVITDDFLLIPNPGSCDPNKDYKLVFSASPLSKQ